MWRKQGPTCALKSTLICRSALPFIILMATLFLGIICGSFQKFCTMYVFFLKMNLFYKIHLQAFSVISIVLYHSGPRFRQVLYSCQDAFIVDASDYLCLLIRHLLNASEAFPTEWFFQFWEQVNGWWAHVRTVRRVGKHLRSILFQNIRYRPWGMSDRWSLHEIWLQSVSSSISKLRFAEHGPHSLPIRTQRSLLKSGSQLLRKSERLHHPTGHACTVCRTFEMTYEEYGLWVSHLRKGYCALVWVGRDRKGRYREAK